MNRRLYRFVVISAAVAVLCTGCHSSQPFYFMEDGDLSHYIGQATDIEYPGVEAPVSPEVSRATTPFNGENPPTAENTWGLSLEEAVRITLNNSKVVRQIGTVGRVFGTNPPVVSSGLLSTTNQLQVASTYDAAIAESDPNTGVEAALSEFDAILVATSTQQKNDRLQNSAAAQIFAPTFQQDTNLTSIELAKRNATGGRTFIRNNTTYDDNNQGFRAVPHDWDTQWEVGFIQPLLRDFGTQVNRIAGPRPINTGVNDRFRNAGEPPNGVAIARILTDQRLADFEIATRDMVANTERAYWELYFAYRNLEAVVKGRDSALATWRKINVLKRFSTTGGRADEEAQAREQYFLFKGQMQRGLATLYAAENRLRFVLGLASTDGRMIRPSDEPTTARVVFDWSEINYEGICRSPEIRRQKWELEKRQLELIANKNLLLPQLDIAGIYRWRGLGERLIDSNGDPHTAPLPTDAFSDLMSGEHQEWQLGLSVTVPLGFRRELAAVRNSELLIAKEKAILSDKELELSHQIADAYRELEVQYQLMQTNYNRRVAARDQVDAVEELFKAGVEPVTLDLVLDAQRRLADAESALFRSVVDYNEAIMDVHTRKGSLLEYNNVYLAEGPWPAKAQFDALHRARQRDAGIYLDYGFTRPNVFSRGPYNQHAGGDRGTTEDGLDGSQRANSGTPTPGGTEDLPPPLPGEPEGPSDMLPQPNGGSVLRLPASSAAGGTATGGVELAVAPSPDDDAAVVAARSRGSYSWKATGATGDAQARANVAAVRLVDHQQATTQPSSSDDESVENQSTAGTAQSASGWKAKR